MKNLLLVTYDCARSDAVYGVGLPTIERLAKSGVSFARAISSSPLTPVSHATVLSGLQPYRHGLRHLFRSPISGTTPLLAEHLRQNGFVTGGIVSCPGMNRWYGFARGFDSYDDEVPLLPDGKSGLESEDVKYRGLAMKRADIVASRAISWLEQRLAGERWFLFAHFFDAHWPYEPPESIAGSRNAYEGELRYVDKHFGRVVDTLERLNLLDDTLVVVFGDHGEDLEGWYPNDKGGAELGHPEENGHGCLLFQQTQAVPLIFSNPTISKAQVDDLCGLVDVAPTVCDLLGVSGFSSFDGQSLAGYVSGASVDGSGRRLYAETLYPRDFAAKNKEFDHLVNLQALWYPDGRKVLRSYGSDHGWVMYDLLTDPLEANPMPVDTAAASTIASDWPVIV
jgi:arylsulfatase